MSDQDFSQNVYLVNPSTETPVTVTSNRLDVNAYITTSNPSAQSISELVNLGYVYSLALSVNMASTGVNNPLILLTNPSGSGKTLYLYEIIWGVDIDNQYANFCLFSSPTITANGTAQTPINRNIGGGFGASAINVYSLSTISSSGNRLISDEVGQNGNSNRRLSDFSVHVKANNSILITGNPKSNNRTAALTVVWAEF